MGFTALAFSELDSGKIFRFCSDFSNGARAKVGNAHKAAKYFNNYFTFCAEKHGKEEILGENKEGKGFKGFKEIKDFKDLKDLKELKDQGCKEQGYEDN